jgi:uncharacterized membrane protein YkvA (DUF1232 family)
MATNSTPATSTATTTVAELDEEEQNLDRLRRWSRELRARDIFGVPEGVDAEERLKRCEAILDGYADEVYRAVHAPSEGTTAMRDWLISLAIAGAALLASWGLLPVLAKRLPPGVLRDLASFIPDCVTTVRRLRKDPRVLRQAKIAIVLAGLWVASPIDLIPEFIPVIGPLDDIVVVALALRYAGRRVPRAVLLAAWPGEPRLIERLLGQAQDGTPSPERAP